MGIFEGTDLATLAHLEDTVLIRGTYIVNEYFTKQTSSYPNAYDCF